MTEYDYSPAAQAAYQAKLRQIAQWTNNVPDRPEELSNPFVPSPRAPESEFYHGKREKERRRSRRGRRRGYESDGYSSSSDSDDDGPSRPPTPPASAPGVVGFYNSPWPQVYPQQQYVSPNVLVPTWNGRQWVLASPVVTATAQASGHEYQRGRGRDRHHHRSRSRSRPKAHRRNSHSVPAAAYAANYPAHYPSHTQPASANTTPSAYTSPLPHSPGIYGPPPGGPGYFAPPTQFQAFHVPQPPMIAPPVRGSVSVQSPPGSVYSAGYYGSPAVSGYNVNPYGAAPYSAGYGQARPGGAVGFLPGPPLVIVDGAKPKKKPSGSVSMKSGRSARSWFGKLTGGM